MYYHAAAALSDMMYNDEFKILDIGLGVQPM